MGKKHIEYSDEIAKTICTAIATTNRGLPWLCKNMTDWPEHSTVYGWMIEHKDFAEAYAIAKRQQIDVLVDEMIDIADDRSHDIITDEHGDRVHDKDHISRVRVMIDTRKWLACKLVPRLYGDRIQHDATIDITTHEAQLEKLR